MKFSTALRTRSMANSNQFSFLSERLLSKKPWSMKEFLLKRFQSSRFRLSTKTRRGVACDPQKRFYSVVKIVALCRAC
jgi:hypothetical protein